MRIIAIVLLFFITDVSAFQNEPDGFRGIKWGTPIADVEAQFGPSPGGKESEMRRRIGDKLSIGDAQIEDLVYFFLNGQFDSVMMKTAGFTNKQALISAFKAQFGEGIKPNRYIDSYIWSGPITRIGLNCRTVLDECTVLIFSTLGAEKKAAARKAAAEKAKQDF